MNHDAYRGSDRPLLIKTETCPACRAATALLDGAGLEYTVLSNTADGYDAATARFGVRHVPTLVLDPDGDWRALVGTDAIKDYLNSRK